MLGNKSEAGDSEIDTVHEKHITSEQENQKAVNNSLVPCIYFWEQKAFILSLSSLFI